jgi:tetratricopeptide (TPR) repeat protein
VAQAVKQIAHENQVAAQTSQVQIPPVPPENNPEAGQLVSVIRSDPQQAAPVLQTAAEQNPSDANLWALASTAKLLAGDKAGSQAAARRALAVDPKNTLAQLVLGHPDQLAAAENRIASLKSPFDTATPQEGTDGAVHVQYDPAARAAADKALASMAAGTTPSATYQDKAQALLQSAVEKLSVGDIHGALFDVSRSLLVDPANSRARVLRAHVSNLPQNHNYEAAIKDSKEALALDPKLAAALFEKGYAELQLGQSAQALSDIEQGLALDPQNGMGHLYHAMALEKSGLIAKAIEEYNQAARLDPALKPLVADALAQLTNSSANMPRGRLPSSIPMKDVLWALLALTAFALIFEGGKRIFYKDWKTSVAAQPDAQLPATAKGTLQPGTMLDGSIRIERELARGGIGIVYQATDVKLKRTVAVKHLSRQAYESGEVREKFLKEAQLAAKLQHPNLAQIFSVVGDAEFYLVFEFVEGETLHDRLVRKIKLPLAEVKQVLREVGEAVDYAHSKNVIHRDLKPANVMFTAKGGYKVMDFGIAHEARRMDDVTMTQAWGTPPYMAPEQEMGAVRKESDLYALGVMLYELLAGQRPFQGAGMLEKKLHGEFPPVDHDAPAALHAFFVKALHPDAAKRFSSAKEMSRALEAIEQTPVRS